MRVPWLGRKIWEFASVPRRLNACPIDEDGAVGMSDLFVLFGPVFFELGFSLC
jgi:hypothetical protein